MGVSFNEIDPVACAVLRECYPGARVIERSIKEVGADDIRDASIVHWFAGAGLWEVARRLAGWPDDRELWTGSCPCQPLSVAGQRKGHVDERHLWPAFYRLIAERRPATIAGEQVAGKDGFEWLAGVRADLESLGYACGAADLPAASVGAPHKRSRLWWIAVADAGSFDAASSPMVDAEGERWGEGRPEHELRSGRNAVAGTDGSSALADSHCEGLEGYEFGGIGVLSAGRDVAARQDSNADSGYWSDAEWLQCADGKARRTKPGLRLLVDGMAGRADLWRLAGNSIVPQVAAQVLGALMEIGS